MTILPILWKTKGFLPISFHNLFTFFTTILHYAPLFLLTLILIQFVKFLHSKVTKFQHLQSRQKRFESFSIQAHQKCPHLPYILCYFQSLRRFYHFHIYIVYQLNNFKLAQWSLKGYFDWTDIGSSLLAAQFLFMKMFHRKAKYLKTWCRQILTLDRYYFEPFQFLAISWN